MEAAAREGVRRKCRHAEASERQARKVEDREGGGMVERALQLRRSRRGKRFKGEEVSLMAAAGAREASPRPRLDTAIPPGVSGKGYGYPGVSVARDAGLGCVKVATFAHRVFDVVGEEDGGQPGTTVPGWNSQTSSVDKF